MSLSNAILSTLAGIPRAVHLDDEMPNRELSQLIRMLSNVHADLVVLQRERRRLEWKRAGYSRQPNWGASTRKAATPSRRTRHER